MTVRTNCVQTCDRCMKPFNEKHLAAGDEVPTFKQKGLVVIETTGTNHDEEHETKVLFAFDDMCPACQKAVAGILDKLRLNTPKKKKRRSRAKKAESKPNGTAKAEKTPDYTEDEPEEKKAAATPAKEEEEKAEAQAEPESEKKEEVQADADSKSGSGGAAEDVPESAGSSAPADGSKAEGENSEDGVIVDEETGDRYNAKTGRLLSEGSKAPAETKSDTGDEAHPF